MKNTFKYFTIVATVFVGISLFPSNVFAEDLTVTPTPTTTKKEYREYKNELKEKRQEIKDQKCEDRTNKSNSLLNRLQNDETIRDNRHQKVVDRLNSIITKLASTSVSTDKLKTDLVTLTELKTKWETEYKTLLTKLTAVKQFPCGNSDGQFVAAVKEANAQRKVMQTANNEFWQFVTKTLQPDIKAAREQLKTSSN